MIAKLPFLKLSGRISIRVPLIAYASSLPSPNYIQTNPQNDLNPPNSIEFEAKIQCLKNKLHPETLIQVLSSTNDLNSSLRLFKWASLQNRFRHNTDTYYHIIMKLGMVNRVDEMEGYCNEMVKSGFSESEQALLRLIDSFIQYRKLDEASRVLFVLNSMQFKPSIALINRLLGALVADKKGINSVLFVYKEMVKASINPKTETLNYLLEALFDADRTDVALDQYKRMRKKECCPNSRTYEIMVSGLIGKSLLDEAIIILNEILEKKCDLESKFFSTILPLLFKINKGDIGLKLFEKMKTLKIVPDLAVYEVLIEYLSNNLLINDAINLFNEMINMDLNPSDRVFVDLINGFCKLNKLNEAKKFLEDNQVTEANSYNVLLKSYCEIDNFVELIIVFRKMVEMNTVNVLSWNILIRYVSENRRNDLVCKVLSKMIVSDFTPDETTYSALIIGKCNLNELDNALILFHRVREESWVLDASCYTFLIESLCENEKISEAFEVFHYMSLYKSTLPESVFSILITGLCQKQKVNKIVNLLSLAYNSGQTCSSSDYGVIIKTLSSLLKDKGILVIFARMVIEGCPLNSETYNELIKSMSLHHRALECAIFLNLMVKESLLPNKEILANSISCLMENNRLHMILPITHRLFSDNEVINPAICNKVINGLWKEGYKNEARSLLDLMLEKSWVPDAVTHRLLISSNDSEIILDYEKSDTKDEIISILSEGFGEL